MSHEEMSAHDGVEMQIAQLKDQAYEFLHEFKRARTSCAPADFPWYPWESLGNFEHLNNLLSGANRDLRNLIGDLPVADVGAADGDVSFFLERQGIVTDLVDYGPTNMNGLHGARLLKKAFDSKVEIHEMDLDSQFHWPRERYGLVFFSGNSLPPEKSVLRAGVNGKGEQACLD